MRGTTCLAWTRVAACRLPTPAGRARGISGLERAPLRPVRTGPVRMLPDRGRTSAGGRHTGLGKPGLPKASRAGADGTRDPAYGARDTAHGARDTAYGLETRPTGSRHGPRARDTAHGLETRHKGLGLRRSGYGASGHGRASGHGALDPGRGPSGRPGPEDLVTPLVGGNAAREGGGARQHGDHGARGPPAHVGTGRTADHRTSAGHRGSGRLSAGGRRAGAARRGRRSPRACARPLGGAPGREWCRRTAGWRGRGQGWPGERGHPLGW
ncbi:hypothetical protein FraQA3DRAFT_0826 [Frankia sp. QA3]|nr:hypothetical protein FraQA3DRAFT_0826 [Frankia sp. QA3]